MDQKKGDWHMANRIIKREFAAADEFEHRHPAKPVLKPGITPTSAPAPRASLQTMMAVQMASPKNPNLYKQALLLDYHIYNWTPQPGPDANVQWQLKQRLGAELRMFEDVLIQEQRVQEMEAGKFAIPPKMTDMSASTAPSMEQLYQDLKALAAFEPTLPPALAEAVKIFQEEFTAYVTEQKSLTAKEPLRRSPHHDEKPQPQD
jgi:hypothetical protein